MRYDRKIWAEIPCGLILDFADYSVIYSPEIDMIYFTSTHTSTGDLPLNIMSSYISSKLFSYSIMTALPECPRMNRAQVVSVVLDEDDADKSHSNDIDAQILLVVGPKSSRYPLDGLDLEHINVRLSRQNCVARHGTGWHRRFARSEWHW